MKTLIIGQGQIGTALQTVLSKSHEVFIRDIPDFQIEGIEVLQICYPEHDGFAETTKRYIQQYKPMLTVINSSVSVGTTDLCGEGVVYSPVRGRHPKLEKDLLLYTKCVFGRNPSLVSMASKYFEECGMDCEEYNDPRAGELIKLVSNVHMGVEIAWRQEVERFLTKFDISPYVYEKWENGYRNGYLRSDDTHLVRPSMKPGPIGGHCILPCTEILKKQYPSKILDFVLESNEKMKGEYNGI